MIEQYTDVCFTLGTVENSHCVPTLLEDGEKRRSTDRITDRLSFVKMLLILHTCIALMLSMPGCTSYRPPIPELPWNTSSPSQNSQVFIPTTDHVGLWEAIVEAVGQTFTIASEEPIRFYDNVLTEGRLETEPKISASVLEPWHNDCVSTGDRVEATFQTIRRRANVRVTPDEGGFLVQVGVYCEKENLSKPIGSAGSGSMIRPVNQNERIVQNSSSTSESDGWFMTERDPALEKQLLRQILYRFKNPPSLIRTSEPASY